MPQLPIDEATGAALVENGHMHPDTFAMAKDMGAFKPTESPPADNTTGLINEKAAYYQSTNPGMSLGDATTKAALDIQGRKDAAAQADQSPQQGFDQSMAALPSTPEQAAQIEAMGGKPGIPGPATSPLQGAQVASNNPTTDMSIAAGMVPQAQAPHPEAGRVDPSNLVMPASAQPQNQVPDAMKPFSDAMAMQSKGLEMASQAGAKKAAEEAGYYHQANQELRRQQAMEHVAEMNRQDETAQGMQKLETAMQDVSAGKVDPNHFWASRTTGQKVMAAVSMALGGLAGGLSGRGGNVGLDIINHAIDRDIETQKSNLNLKQQGYQNQAGLFGMMRQRFGDERQAALATRAAYLQSVEMQVHELAARSDSTIVAGNAMAMLGQVKAAQEQTKLQLQHSFYEMSALKQLQGGNTSGLNLEALPEKVRERAVYLDGGKRTAIALTSDGAKSVREVSSAADDVRDTIAEMRKLRDEGPRVLPYGTLQAKAQQLQSRLIPQLNELAGLKRLSEEDIKNLQKQIPDPGSWLTSRNGALLDGLEQGVHDRVESYYRNNLQGYKPVQFKRAE